MAILKHPFMKISMAGSKATMDFFGSIMSDDEPEMDDNGKPVPGVKFGAYKAAIDGMKAEGVTDLDLLINTPGGDIVSGLAMYDLNKSCGLNIDMTVIGMCASMGTVMIWSGSQLLACICWISKRRRNRCATSSSAASVCSLVSPCASLMNRLASSWSRNCLACVRVANLSS